jgi:hypothetical protein
VSYTIVPAVLHTTKESRDKTKIYYQPTSHISINIGARRFGISAMSYVNFEVDCHVLVKSTNILLNNNESSKWISQELTIQFVQHFPAQHYDRLPSLNSEFIQNHQHALPLPAPLI